eukprot:TRINITY_DN753_c1_g1_i1.p1 TRINITY_DN753_c1_g1~~TRINITY_DN753_c1_g1_i1.p1  ORF type:complete len:257 (-),score=58.02 TRINITY_DN753_c1_g1_i1:105-875(-)
MDSLLTLFNRFKNEVDHGSDFASAASLLEQLKIEMTKFSFLFPAQTSEKDLLFSREVLEYGVLLSVKSKDIESFDRNIRQLKTYYYDLKHQLPESQRMYSILGLNLLRLLAQNRLAEFHTELELLPIDQHSNLYIKYPVQLEQYMMEGSYNAVFNGETNLPSENYRYFQTLLFETVQDRIADCCESAYHVLTVQDAQTIIRFSHQHQLVEFAKKRNWEIRDGVVHFKEDEKKKVEVPAKPLIQRTLNYAKELERII